MPENTAMDEKTLNLVANESVKRDETHLELSTQLYEALHPQAKELVNQAAELYRQASDRLMRLVPGDWDVDLFPEPATEPVPVSLVRLLNVEGKPSRELELNIRGKDQIALVHTDIKDGTQQEHLFQRFNPKDLSAEQRQKCAEAISNAQNNLLLQNEGVLMDPNQHDKQLATEIDAFNNGLDIDIWVPFDAQNSDANGEQATHLINWGGERPEVVAGTYLADMAGDSAYRDNPSNVASLVADHLNIHPIRDVFKTNVLDRVLTPKRSSIAVNHDDQHATLIGEQVNISQLDASTILPSLNHSSDRLHDAVEAVKIGLKPDAKFTYKQGPLDTVPMGTLTPLSQLNENILSPNLKNSGPNVHKILDDIQKNGL